MMCIDNYKKMYVGVGVWVWVCARACIIIKNNLDCTYTVHKERNDMFDDDGGDDDDDYDDIDR